MQKLMNGKPYQHGIVNHIQFLRMLIKLSMLLKKNINITHFQVLLMP